MRVLIVDDEGPARERLRRLLAAFDDLQVVGEARDAEEALSQVAALTPDAVFLDVQMPGASGLDVAASLPEPPPAVVFVTAHDRYAVQAFDNAALDYLLKPVEPDRLARAIQRLRAAPRIAARASLGAAAQLLIPERGRTHVVRCADIEWLQAADNYVELHFAGRSLLMRRTLAGLLCDLGPGFVQVHRSAAVALARVQSVRPRERGDAEVLLGSGAQVPCSRQYRSALMARLQAHRPSAP